MKSFWIHSLLFFLCVLKVSAVQRLEHEKRLTGANVVASFTPQQEVIQKASAAIYSGRKLLAYGVVFSADGLILSKSSELKGIEDLKVRINRDVFQSVKIQGADDIWDVVLLKVDAKDLSPAKVSKISNPKLGTIVIANGATSAKKRRVLGGVISANKRELFALGGLILGVVYEKDSLKVKSIVKASGAEAAGIKAGDEILAINHQPVKDLSEAIESIKDKKARDEVAVKLKRGKEELELTVVLKPRNEVITPPDRNDMMSGDFSKRRSGFPEVIQHDIGGSSFTMGGPLLDLKGELLGMNIARANRAETFAIPAEKLEEIVSGILQQK